MAEQVAPDPQFQARVADILAIVGEGDWELDYDRQTMQYSIVGTPEINLQFEDPNSPGTWVNVPDNVLTAIPGTIPSGAPQIINFRFQNLGGADLDLSGTLVDQGQTGLDGAPSYGVPTPATLPKGQNSTFTATISKAAPGAATFDFDMPNDDPNEDPYRARLSANFS